MDREKIIKALERCLTLDSACGDCPYYSHEDIQELDCERNLQHDALALLKEQEERIEQLNRFVNGFSRDAVPVVRCKDCKYYDYFNGCMSWHDVNSNNDNWYCADGEGW